MCAYPQGVCVYVRPIFMNRVTAVWLSVIPPAMPLPQSQIDNLKSKVEKLESERDLLKKSERALEEKVCDR